MRIAIVVSEFNFDITAPMLERAKHQLEHHQAELAAEIHVPGVFDMGPAIKGLLRRKDVDGVVILGAVIKGETLHDEQNLGKEREHRALQYHGRAVTRDYVFGSARVISSQTEMFLPSTTVLSARA